MDENHNAHEETAEEENEKALREFWVVVLYISGSVLGLGIVIAVLIAFSRLLNPAISDPVQFVTANLLNTLIFAAIVAQVLIYRKQRDIMKEQQEVMKKQWTLSRDALTKLERPFVFRESISWLWHPDTGRQGRYWYSIHPVLVNSGKSPTVNMQLRVNFTVRDTPLPDDFNYPYSESSKPTVIGPQSKIASGPIRISDDDMLAIQNGTKHLYLWGKAEYRDIFDDTPTHTTRFCNRIGEVLGNPLDPRDTRDHKGTSLQIAFEIHGSAYNSIH